VRLQQLAGRDLCFPWGDVEKHKESDKVVGDFETFIGSAFADHITNSTKLALRIQGGDGNDTIIGGSNT